MARPKSGVVGKLADRGEQAMERFKEALGNAVPGKLDSASRAAFTQLGLATSDDVRELREQLEVLQCRVDEATGGKAKSTAKRRETKKTPTAARRTRKASKPVGEEAPSPSAGRSLGGGTARGGAAGGGTAVS